MFPICKVTLGIGADVVVRDGGETGFCGDGDSGAAIGSEEEATGTIMVCAKKDFSVKYEPRASAITTMKSKMYFLFMQISCSG